MDRRKIASIAIGLVAAGFVLYWAGRPLRREEAIPPPGSIYYEGPMKSKGGTWGTADGKEAPRPSRPPVVFTEEK